MFEGIIDLLTMKAEVYDKNDATGKEFEIVDIPREYEGRNWKQHDLR